MTLRNARCNDKESYKNFLKCLRSITIRYDHTLCSQGQYQNVSCAVGPIAATSNKPSLLLTSRRLSLHSAFSVFIPHKSRRARPAECMWDCAVPAATFLFLFQCNTKVGIWSECHGSTIEPPTSGVSDPCTSHVVSHKKISSHSPLGKYRLVLSHPHVTDRLIM